MYAGGNLRNGKVVKLTTRKDESKREVQKNWNITEIKKERHIRDSDDPKGHENLRSCQDSNLESSDP